MISLVLSFCILLNQELIICHQGTGMFQPKSEEFCSVCGSILPLPEMATSTVHCVLCKSKWLPWIKSGQLISRYERNYEKGSAELGEVQEEEDVTVEHQCPKCDCNVATYTTQQTRSADEGQTVFYQCVRCKFRCIEYS